MKQKISAILVCFILFTGIALSQDGPDKHSKERKKFSADDMVKRDMKMLKSELDLTESQATIVQKVLQDSYKKMEEQFKSGNKDRDAIENIMEEKDSNLQKVLTDEQWTKYKELKSRNKDKFRNGDDKQPPPPDKN
jgi:hypothetical protein